MVEILINAHIVGEKSEQVSYKAKKLTDAIYHLESGLMS